MAIEIKPQPGPQTAFLSSPADIAIYGGSAGGGKSYALLLEPLRHTGNKAFGAVVFRRTLADVKKQGSLLDTSLALYGQLGAKLRQDSPIAWTFPAGAKITFGHLEHETTVLDWQGAQVPLLCCEENERVRLADGGLKSVKDLAVGDLVQTLSGPRAVRWKSEPRLEECVTATVTDYRGDIVGVQVHSVTHKVLTPRSGWLSFADMSGEVRRASFFASKVVRFARKSADMFGRICLFPWLLLGSLSCRRLRPQELYGSPLGHRSALARDAYTGRLSRDSYFGSSRYGSLERERQPSVRLPVVLAQPRDAQSDHVDDPDLGSGAIAYVRRGLALVGFRVGCSSYPHPDGELVASRKDSGRDFVQRLADVARRSRMGWLSDALGKVQKRSRRKLRYAHPYAGSKLTAEVPVGYGSCRMVPCGPCRVLDINVEGVSHYITEVGLSNQNCFDELTHFSRNQFFYLLSRNRSTCGVRPYVRATTNPDADSWVAEFIAWWIDQETGSPIWERAGRLRWFARVGDVLQWTDTADELREIFPGSEPKSLTFIPARLEDNAILMKADPGYRANLLAMPRVDRERLLGGNWKVRPAAGMYFKREWCEIVDVLPPCNEFVRGWDLAATPKTETNDPDWTAGTKIGKLTDGRYVVAHHLRMRGGPMDVERTLKNIATQDDASMPTRIQIPQDPAQAGKYQRQTLAKLLTGHDVRFAPAGTAGGKETRFRAFSAQAEAGNVIVLRGPWNEDWLTSLEAFPESGHDDDVDSTSEAFNALFRGVPVAMTGRFM